MLFNAGRLCAIFAYLALAGCGRIGVLPIPEELVDPDPNISPPEEELYRFDASGDAGLPADADVPAEAGAQLDGSAPLDGGTGLDATTGQDASTPQDANGAQDVGPDAQDAASSADAAPEASLPACGGQRVLGLCWYLSALDESCEETCTSRGGYDTRMVGTVGTVTQGGGLANCTQVLGALGHTGTVGEGQRMDDVGVGCHVWDADAWWLKTMPNFNPASSAPSVRIACACLR